MSGPERQRWGGFGDKARVGELMSEDEGVRSLTGTNVEREEMSSLPSFKAIPFPTLATPHISSESFPIPSVPFHPRPFFSFSQHFMYPDALFDYPFVIFDGSCFAFALSETGDG